MKKLLLSLFLLVPAYSYAGPINQLVNGSFETGDFTGWTVGGTSGDPFPPVVIPYNSGATYPGGAFGEPIPPDDAAGNPGLDPVGGFAAYFAADLARPQTLSQQVSIVAGTSYTFGFDVYLPGNGAANPNDATLSATVGGQTFASFSASATPVQDWLHFSSATTAGSTGIATFSFEYNSFGVPAKDFVVDRVYFAETSAVAPEPGALGLLGLGLAGLSLSRRRRLIA